MAVLKIVHNHVIDTSVRYKHPSPGYKHALRYLSTTYLNRSIQNQNGGHNSIEDARAALDLVVYYADGVAILEYNQSRELVLRTVLRK